MTQSNSGAGSRIDTNDLRSMAQDMKSAAQEKFGAASEKVQQFGSDMKQAAQDRFEGMQSQASEYYEQGRKKMHQLEHSLEHRVREQPLTYLVVAGSLGFALGFLFTRR